MKKNSTSPKLLRYPASSAINPQTATIFVLDKGWARKLPISKPFRSATSITRVGKVFTLWERAFGRLNTVRKRLCLKKPSHFCEVTGYSIPVKFS